MQSKYHSSFSSWYHSDCAILHLNDISHFWKWREWCDTCCVLGSVFCKSHDKFSTFWSRMNGTLVAQVLKQANQKMHLQTTMLFYINMPKLVFSLWKAVVLSLLGHGTLLISILQQHHIHVWSLEQACSHWGTWKKLVAKKKSKIISEWSDLHELLK